MNSVVSFQGYRQEIIIAVAQSSPTVFCAPAILYFFSTFKMNVFKPSSDVLDKLFYLAQLTRMKVILESCQGDSCHCSALGRNILMLTQTPRIHSHKKCDVVKHVENLTKQPDQLQKGKEKTNGLRFFHHKPQEPPAERTRMQPSVFTPRALTNRAREEGK